MADVPSIQLTLDCRDPHSQADFWSATLGYEVETNPDFVQQMVDEGLAGPSDVTEHKGVLVFADGSSMRDPSGTRPRWYFQKVDESKAAKNRMHIDVHVGAENVRAEVERLSALGATRLYDGQQGPHSWVTMADPEGNEFCVA